MSTVDFLFYFLFKLIIQSTSPKTQESHRFHPYKDEICGIFILQTKHESDIYSIEITFFCCLQSVVPNAVDFYNDRKEVLSMASIQLSFGKCIRFYRNKIGLSQEKFALLINMDRTYYASVEAGKRNISIANIEKIANGLGVPISQLFMCIETDEKANK